jgi:hypothetical protein
MAELEFDTRVNYQKKYLDGSADLSVANPSASTSTTITHNLGYIPNVRVWFLNGDNNMSTAVTDAAGSNLSPITSAYTQRSCYYKVNTTSLVITFNRTVTVGTTRTTTVYYRIYLDSA